MPADATTALLYSLQAEQRRCDGGEFVCRHKCKRCERYIDWCLANGKRPNR